MRRTFIDSFQKVPRDPIEALVELQGDLAKQLELTLGSLDLTQRELSDRSKVNAVNISRIMSGGNNTTLATIASLQAALGQRLVTFPWVEEVSQMSLIGTLEDNVYETSSNDNDQFHDYGIERRVRSSDYRITSSEEKESEISKKMNYAQAA